MKKVILSAAFVAIAGFTAARANTISNSETVYAVQDSTQSKTVALDELPAPVKTTLTADAYKDWTPVSAVHVKDSKGEYYQITVKRGDEQGTLKIDAAGKAVE